MTNETSELPVFPTDAPGVFRDPDRLGPLFADVLDRLAVVVDVDDAVLGAATPCDGYDVAQLRQHVLGWLQFFAVALTNPNSPDRPDPAVFELGDTSPVDVVRVAKADIGRAIDGGVAGQLVTMSQARMAGDGVLGMALGEYIIHAWDLASATGQSYEPPVDAIGPAHEFLQAMVAPQFRGPESGFFDAEIVVGPDAAPIERLLGFAGRDPAWTP